MTQFPRLLGLLDRKSDRLLARLAEAEPHVLHRPPIEGAWSPLQVMHHVALVERTAADYLLYKYGQPTRVPPPLTWAARARGKLVVAALLSPLKFKAPRPVDVGGQDLLDAPTLGDLRVMMTESRTDLRNLTERADPAWLSRAVFRHPRAGHISLDDLGRMLVVHHDRHARQIERGLAKNARDHGR